MTENQETGPPPTDVTRLGRGQLVDEVHRLRGLLDQTQAKLEEMTGEKHRLEQANIEMGREVDGLTRELTRAQDRADRFLKEIATDKEIATEKRGERVARTS